MLDAPTLASIVQEAVTSLSNDCLLSAHLPEIAVAAGQIVRRAMDHAVALSQGNPDEGMLIEMWAGNALTGLLTANVDITKENLPAIPEEPAARAAFDYAQAMLAEWKRRRA